MNRNQLKIIACISMLIDHIGYIIFPGVTALRLIGRLAMPLFAFFIGEGCLYTKNRKKYFLRVFLLGLLCQAVYIAESLITDSDGGAYLNILLTFSVSIILCSSFIRAKESFKNENQREKIKNITVFLLTFAAVFTLTAFCENSLATVGIGIEFDYGVFGICLPLFAAASNIKCNKLISFSVAHIVLAYNFYGLNSLFFCSLIPLVLLLFYNGKGGKKNLKYFFYAFYPCHLALIYLVSFII